VQADGDVHGPRDHVSPALKVMTRVSPVNTVSDVAAVRHGRNGELLALLMAGFGPKRRFAAVQKRGRFLGCCGLPCRPMGGGLQTFPALSTGACGRYVTRSLSLLGGASRMQTAG
jgi:hypothetical protein